MRIQVSQLLQIDFCQIEIMGWGGEAGAWRYRPNPEIMDLADLSGLSMGAYSGGAR